MRIIIAAVFVVILAVHAKESKKPSSMEECLADYGIKPEEFAELHDKEDPKLHCIMACFFEREGMINNGELDRNSTIKILLAKNSKINKTELTKLVDSCMEEVKDVTDICDITNDFRKCIEKSD